MSLSYPSLTMFQVGQDDKVLPHLPVEVVSCLLVCLIHVPILDQEAVLVDRISEGKQLKMFDSPGLFLISLVPPVASGCLFALDVHDWPWLERRHEGHLPRVSRIANSSCNRSHDLYANLRSLI